MAEKLPRTFWLLLSGSFLNRVGTFVVPFLAIYLTQMRGYTLPEAGITISLLGLGSVLAGPIGGTLTDKAGRKITLALGLSLAAVFLVAIYFARARWQIGCSVFLLGLGGDIFRPALFATISDLIPPAQRSRAFGLTYWAHNFGFFVAMPLGGFFASRSFGALFIADAGTNLVFALLILLAIPETRPQHISPPHISHESSPNLSHDSSVTPRTPKGPQDIRAALVDLPFLAFCSMNMLVSLVLMQVLGALPLSMQSQGIDAAAFGKIVAVNGAMIVLLQPLAERAVGWMRPSRRVSLAIAVIGVGLGLQGFCSTPLQYVLAIAVWSLGEIAYAGIGPTVVSHLAPVHLRGAYQGLYGMSMSAGVLLAPSIGLPLLAAAGPRVLWGCAAGAAMVSAGGMFALGRRIERAGTEL